MAKIAEALGTNRRTLERKLATYSPADNAESKAEAREGAEALASLGLTGMPAEEQKARAAQIARAQAAIALELEQQGEHDEARKARDLELRAIRGAAQLDRQTPEDVVTIPKAELAEKDRETMRKLVAIAESRPMLCAHCSRELSIAWSEGRK
jgi:hypothetical protein